MTRKHGIILELNTHKKQAVRNYGKMLVKVKESQMQKSDTKW